MQLGCDYSFPFAAYPLPHEGSQAPPAKLSKHLSVQNICIVNAPPPRAFCCWKHLCNQA